MTGFRFVIFPNDADCFFLNGKCKIFETTHTKKRGGQGEERRLQDLLVSVIFGQITLQGRELGYLVASEEVISCVGNGVK